MLHFFQLPTKIYEGSAGLLSEREHVENAIKLATETGQPQPIKVDGKEYNVESNGYGTEIKPSA